MISFSHVSKRYPGGFEALRDVSLSIEAGEMVFVTGHSGAGKSTLLKLIAAIERPTSGTVIVNGQNVGALQAAGDAVPAPQFRPDLPGPQAALRPQRVRQRRAAAAHHRLQPRRGRAPRARRARQGRAARHGKGRPDHALRRRAAAARASRAPSCTGRRSCSPTSRPATSTPPTPPSSASCSGRSTRSA